MPSPAIYDFFRQIKIIAPDLVTVEATLEADSTTDILTINPSAGVKFTGTESTDTFSIDVDYSIYVPLGTTAITLQDVNLNTTDINISSGPGVTVLRNGNNELEIGLDEGYTAIKRFAIGADDSTLRFLDDGESALFLGTGGITTSSDAEGNITIDGSGISSGALGSLSVTTNAAGTAALSYDSGTGVFTYTPPDLSSYLTSEANDLTTAVTWANVPDANITQSSVTQHEAALSINENQINFTSSFIELIDLSATQLAASGNGSLSYNNSTGVFTYTPPDLSSYLTDYTVTEADVTQYEAQLSINESQINFTSSFIELFDLSATQLAASGNGSLSYNNTTGVFTYTPPDLSSYLTDYTVTEADVTQHEAALSINESQVTFTSSFIELIDLSATQLAASGNGSLSYNNTTGVFTYTPPDLSSYLTSEANDLTASVTWANVPDANITQSSVTQHQAALSITESQISDLQSYLTAVPSSITVTDITFGKPVQPQTTKGSPAATETFDCSSTQAFLVTSVGNDFVVNLTNLGLGNNESTEVKITIAQQATAYDITGLEIAGASQTIEWLDGITPSGTSLNYDVYKFTIFTNALGNYFVFGKLETYS